MEDACLVLEGGGLRGVFTSGVLERFMEEGISFSRVVGVSAGACTGASYLSGQRGRNWKVNVEYPSDSRYMGLRYLLSTGSYFNLDFVFGEIPRKLVPYDEGAALSNPAEFDVVTTSLSTGKSVVLGKEAMRRIGVCAALVASSSMPLLAPPAEIDGEFYYDGGVSDSIPVRYALERHGKAVVVLTRPRGYRKGRQEMVPLMRRAFGKHPEFLEALLSRNEGYNRTLEFVAERERAGKLLVIAPSDRYAVGRTEKSREKRAEFYAHGYQCALDASDRLRDFLSRV